MNLFQQYDRLRFWIASMVIVIMMTACGGVENSGSALTESTPDSSNTSAVAYGASLDEWEEATQGDEEPSSSSSDEQFAFVIGVPVTFNNVVYQEIMWDGLIPPNYSADAIMSRYEEELAAISDGSPEAAELYTTMQQEFSEAPVYEMLDDTMVRIPGFITPLEYEDDLITEFLLVPYFGACIHVPAPPANQTILVRVAEGQGIRSEDSYYPIWVMGRLTTEGTTTELAEAGYYIQDGTFESYMSN